jgi:hypothetical protein
MSKLDDENYLRARGELRKQVSRNGLPELNRLFPSLESAGKAYKERKREYAEHGLDADLAIVHRERTNDYFVSLMGYPKPSGKYRLRD